MLNHKLTKQPLEYLLILILFLSIAVSLVVYGVINFLGFPLFCDSDMYADTLISKLIWENHSLFPEGWIFGNQYYVLATPVLSALLYGLVGNTNLAMVLATELMTLLLILSLFYVLRCFTKDILLYLASVLILLSCSFAPTGVYSTHAQLLFLMCSFYSCYLITFFIVLGDYIRAVQTPHRSRLGMLGFSLVLCFATGIQSLRQTAIMILPLLACEMLLSLRRWIRKEKIWNTTSLSRVLLYFTANVAGLFTLQKISPPHYTIYGRAAPLTFATIQARVIDAWHGFLKISGLTYWNDPDVNPIYCIFSLFLILLFLAALCLWLRKIRHQEQPMLLCWLVSLLSVLSVFFATIVTSTAMRSIYLFTWFSVLVFSALLVLTHLPALAKNLVLLLLCVLSLGNITISYRSQFQSAIWYQQQSVRTDYVQNRQLDDLSLCLWAMDHGYEYVYGDWFTSPQIAVHSGGKLTAGYWWRSQPLHPLGYLNLQNIYGAEENAKAIYVVTDADEDAVLAAAAEQGVTMTQVVTMGKYTAYTSPVPLMEGQTLSYE